jgi:transglutaminase-like putative cysteine protease
LLERDTAAVGFTYTVESALPDFEPDTLRAAPDRVLPSIGERYLALPELDPRVVELAERIVADAASPYDRALALQNHLRDFEYSLTVPTGHSESALARFLFDDQAGYCEQFSTAFAAMARVVGLPSRVAVGFTVGEQSASDPELYTVRGEHAHAWPEVWFSGIGWVPFEPTPGRGDPRSAEHTGVAPQQVGPTTTTTTSTTAPGDLPSTSFDPSLLPDFAEGLPGASTGSSTSDGVPAALVVLAALVGVVAAWVLVVATAVWVRGWRRRRRAGDDPGRLVLAAWDDVVDAARSHRLVPTPTETHREFARRVVGALGEHDPAPLTRLAEQAAAARFGAAPSVDPAVAFEAAAGAVGALGQARGRRQQVVDLVDLRRGLPRRRAAGARRHATMSGAAPRSSAATG